MFKAISRLATGSAFAQLLSFAALPLVMRYYTPLDYGMFGTAMVCVSVGAVVATGQVQQVVILPRVTSHALGLFWLGVTGAALGGVFLFILSVLFLSSVQMEAVSSVWTLASLVGVGVLGTGFSQCVQAVSLRKRAFSELAVAAVLRALLAIVFQMLFGLYASSANALLAAYCIGEILSAYYLWVKTFSKSEQVFPWLRFVRYKALLRGNKDACVYGTLQESLNTASQGVPVVVLGFFFGPAAAGFYSFSTRVLLAPVQLVANSVRQAVLVRFSDKAKEAVPLKEDFIRLTLSLFLPVAVFSLLIFSYLPDIYAFAFGERWRVAGDYAYWLVFWAGFLIFNAPATVVMRVLRRQKESFYYNLAMFFFRLSALVLCGFLASENVSVAVFSLVGAVMNSLYIYMAFRLIVRS